MTPELHAHLLCIFDDAIERAENHLDWLALHPNEPDREAHCGHRTFNRIEQAVSRFALTFAVDAAGFVLGPATGISTL
jgi:hypothetical protein